MAVVPPLSPPPEIPPSELHVSSHFARACIPLSPPLVSSPSVFRLEVVVVLSKCPDDGCGRAPPPLTCAAGSTWLGCWWRGLGDGAPPMVVWSSMRLAIPTSSIFRALDTPRSSRPPQWSGVPVSLLFVSRLPGSVPA